MNDTRVGVRGRRILFAVGVAVLVTGMAGCADEDSAKAAGNKTAATPVGKETAAADATMTPENTSPMAPDNIFAQAPKPNRGPAGNGSWYADPTDAAKPGYGLGLEGNVPASVTATSAAPPLLGHGAPPPH